MDPDPLSSAYSLYPVISLVILNALFVGAEYALISCDPSNVKNTKSKKGTAAEWLIDNSELCVASIQLAITACSLLVGWFGIQALTPGIDKFLLANFDYSLFVVANHQNFSFLISLLGIVMIHVIFGELIMKAVATSFPEATLRYLAWAVKFFTLVSYPLSRITYVTGNMLLKPFRLTVGQTDKDLLSIKELKRLFSSVPSSSDIGTEQAMMIRGVVGFSETVAREVMTPRTDLTTIKVSSSLEEIVSIIIESGFSRLPVRGDKLDDVLGIILAKDVIPYIKGNKPFDIRRVMRQAYFIPGTKPIDELLSEFKRKKTHMAIILDEHGGLDGVVTMEDLIEEIVGDIFDEGDELEKDIIVAANGDIVINGGVLVADINERFGILIPEGEYDTVAGFIFNCIGRMPVKGDEIHVDFDNKSHIFINGLIVPLGAESEYDIDEYTTQEITNGIRIVISKVHGHRIETINLTILSKNSSTKTESQNKEPASEG